MIWVHAFGLAGDVGPYPGLIRDSALPLGQARTDGSDLDRPAGGEVDARRRAEDLGEIVPASLLDAGDRDHDFAVGQGQDGQIQDPILLRPDQLAQESEGKDQIASWMAKQPFIGDGHEIMISSW